VLNKCEFVFARSIYGLDCPGKTQAIRILARCVGFLTLLNFLVWLQSGITATGHKDNALEYGKDIWIDYGLPPQPVLYFGIQARKGKPDATVGSSGSKANIAETHHQVLIMLGHEIFGSETSKRVLVDHAFIVSAGKTTRQAKHWLGEN
jgi:hypothetical protein